MGALAAAEKTTTSYLDTGAIFSTTDGTTGLSTRYDYTPEGWQSARLPDGTGTPGVVDYTRAMYTDYYPDGLESAARDLASQRELFSYDADGNQTLAIEAVGIEQASQSRPGAGSRRPRKRETAFDLGSRSAGLVCWTCAT